jgi:hypothetical protein
VTAERLFAWTAAAAAVAVTWLGYTALPAPSERSVALGLGAVAALPLAVVFLAWASSFRGGTRGWE